MVTARVAVALAFLIMCTSVGHAQERSAGGRFAVGLGLGVGRASISVGEDAASEAGLSYSGYAAVRSGWHSMVVLEVDVQPHKVENPSRAEAFRSQYYLLAAHFYPAAPLHLRPAVGLQRRQWSGADPVTNSDGGIAIGLAAGYEFLHTRNIALASELFWRSALIELEGNVTAGLLGLRLVAGIRP